MAQTTSAQSVNTCTNILPCGNPIGSYNRIFNRSDEDAQIMRWLSPLEPGNRHRNIRNDRLGGVGEWLLETSEFREWRGGVAGADKALLFCPGNPGVGKTYLSSLVIDRLCDQAEKEDIAVAWLYYDYHAEREQTITNMMGAILKQLVGRGDILNNVREVFQKDKKIGSRGLLLADLMRMLRVAVASLPRVFICIDAVDECQPKHLLELLKSLGGIVGAGARVFITGRHHVTGVIQKYFPVAVITPIAPNRGDIRNYLEMKLDTDVDPAAMDNFLRTDIEKIIPDQTSDIFLLVSLSIDHILSEVTIAGRRKGLKEMARGNGLGDAYTETLWRLKAQEGKRSLLGMNVLMWVSYSERPLRAEELCHALAVEIGSADLDLNYVPAIPTLIASCLGLVTVEASSSIVRPVHFTLPQHLLSNPTLFDFPNSTIAEVCLTYLNFGCTRGLSPTLDSAPLTMPFLEYASLYWGNHIRIGMTENTKMLALRLLDRFDEHISAQLLLLRYNEDSYFDLWFDEEKGPTGFTGLHGVSFLGVVGMVAPVLEMKGWDVNATDCMGITALVWAARKGYEEVVKTLLEREDINPVKADTDCGQTPLSWAAENGHAGVVKMLLERKDVNPNQPDTFRGQTPLSLAAEMGHEWVVKMLLEREDVDPDQPDTFRGQTPLSLAAEMGHDEVVKILLEREDINPDQPDPYCGQTPLSWAAESRREGVVRMLLERDDVNPSQPDTIYGRTPLLLAAASGHEGVLKILLKREDVNPDQPDAEYGHTPLAWAAENGHRGVVKMLLERRGIGATALDHGGQTPPSLALSEAHNEAVRILRDNANSSHTADRGGPASLSPSAGHVDLCAVDMQSISYNPNTNITDLNGQPAPPPADPNEQKGGLDPKGPIPQPAGSGLSSPKPSRLKRLRSTTLLKFFLPPKKTKTHHNNVR